MLCGQDFIPLLNLVLKDVRRSDEDDLGIFGPPLLEVFLLAEVAVIQVLGNLS